MKPFSLATYLNQFIQDENLGRRLFFKEQGSSHHYRDLALLSKKYAHQLNHSTHSNVALQTKSSYLLFAQIIACILAKKKAFIFSSKEPLTSMQDYRARFNISLSLDDSPPLESSESLIIQDEISEDSEAFTILSSGTTGAPKAIILTLKNVHASAQIFIDYFQMNKDDISFLNLPHHHIGGLMILWRAFFRTSPITINEDDDYQFISLVPLQLQRLMQVPKSLEKLKICKAVLIGGALLEERLKKEALTEKIKIYETYGMSETASFVLINGKSLPEQKIKLSPEGYFLIKGPTLSPFVTVDEDGFFHTKDVGLQHEDGTFSFSHRSDLLFKSAGEFINPLLIESKIKELPWIKEAISVPIKHPEWTFAQALVYKTEDDSKDSEEIKKFLFNQVHPYQIPRFFFRASAESLQEGIKPSRFRVTQFAQEQYFKTFLNTKFIPGNNAKKLIVYFHGFMEDHSDMLELIGFEDASYLFIDFPGHGQSKISSFKNRKDLFSTIAHLIEFYQDQKELILYGYSMGGRVALELTSEYLKPSLLILESSSFGLKTLEEKKQRLDEDLKLFKNVDDLKTFFYEWYKNPIFADYNKTLNFNDDINKKCNHNMNEWQGALSFISPGASPYLLEDIVSKIATQKILAIAGKKDLKYRNHFQEVKKLLPGMTLYEIENAGHNPHKTHLQELKSILKLFL